MKNLHTKNIKYLYKLIKLEEFSWLNYKEKIEINFFNKGGGTYLYLIENGKNKYIARINFFPGKNEWLVKRQEYEVLKEIKNLKIAPKSYFLSEKNELNQDIIIVDYIEGEILEEITDKNIFYLSDYLSKLHNFKVSEKFGMGFPATEKLPYKFYIYDDFANGDDKKIENYLDFEGIENVVEIYNKLNLELKNIVKNTKLFNGKNKFCICHGDLKKENILENENGIVLIDWECSEFNIPEADIARLFSECNFLEKQEKLFLDNYLKKNKNFEISLEIIELIKLIHDFFHIIEDYLILKRKKWNADEMLLELKKFEKYNLIKNL